MDSLYWLNSRIEKFGEIMFDFRLLNVEKLVHQFIINLNAKLRISPCKRLGKVQFISQVDKSLQVEKELISMSEKMKDVAAQQHFDIPDEKSVEHFIEKKTNFLDKRIHHSSTHLLTSHLRSTNRNIIQRVIKSKKHSFREVGKSNLRQNHEPSNKKAKENTPIEDESFYLNLNKEKGHVIQNDSKTCSNIATPKHSNGTKRNNSVLDRKELEGPCNPLSKLTDYTKREIRNTTQFLALCVRDDEFKKRNVHITLYISIKDLIRHNRISDAKRDEIHLLCQRAILCSIEPSEKAFVLFKDDLSPIIQNHLSLGYTDHFDLRKYSNDEHCNMFEKPNSQLSYSNCEGRYTALLILSRWAKILVKDPDNILIRTLAGIMNCSTDQILVLSCLQEK